MVCPLLKCRRRMEGGSKKWGLAVTQWQQPALEVCSEVLVERAAGDRSRSLGSTAAAAGELGNGVEPEPLVGWVGLPWTWSR